MKKTISVLLAIMMIMLSLLPTMVLAEERDKTYEINYLSFATKSGRLQSENAGFDYFTSGDLVGLWENLSGESKVVSP